MAKYINADKMLEEYEHGIYDTTDLAEMLYYMPAADVVEVRHGYWVDDYYDQMDGGAYPITVCSVCETPNPVSNYCPNCGAKMDGEQNE